MPVTRALRGKPAGGMEERASPLATRTRADRSEISERLPALGAHPTLTRRITAPLGRRRLKIATAALVALATAGTVAIAVPAAADPGGSAPPSGTHSSATQPRQPSTASEAKQAWLDAATNSEAANEQLLTAQQREKQAQQGVLDAKVAVAEATLNASAAQADSVQAAAKYALYREQLAQFASASFRGARLGQLSALLTAPSTSDFLDEVSSLDQVAGSTKALMLEALAARDAATAAAAKAADAQAAATAASARADQALADARSATKAVADRKAKLDNQVAIYHRLFSALTGEERAAAMRAQQTAWEEQSQRAVQQQAAERRVAGQVDGNADAGVQALSADSGPNGPVAAAGAKAQIAVSAALSRLGMPYVYGATGPSRFDCSGLTSWAWAQAGISIPRTSSGQAGLPVVPLDQLQPGDLITYYSPVHHVAMYIGNGQIVHASTEGMPVFITSMYRGGPYPVGHRVNY